LFDDNTDKSTLTSSLYWTGNEPVPIEGYDYEADEWFECNTSGSSYKFYQMYNPETMRKYVDGNQFTRYRKANGV
jgi:hypothetical protein